MGARALSVGGILPRDDVLLRVTQPLENKRLKKHHDMTIHL